VTLTNRQVIEAAATPGESPERVAVAREQQDGAVVDDDLHDSPVVLDA
jgi:hypothetical protein